MNDLRTKNRVGAVFANLSPKSSLTYLIYSLLWGLFLYVLVDVPLPAVGTTSFPVLLLRTDFLSAPKSSLP